MHRGFGRAVGSWAQARMIQHFCGRAQHASTESGHGPKSGEFSPFHVNGTCWRGAKALEASRPRCHSYGNRRAGLLPLRAYYPAGQSRTGLPDVRLHAALGLPRTAVKPIAGLYASRYGVVWTPRPGGGGGFGDQRTGGPLRPAADSVLCW